MIDVSLEATEHTGDVVLWKTQISGETPLKELVKQWSARYHVGQLTPFFGAGLQTPGEDEKLDLGRTPSQLSWQSGDPCRTLWVVPLDQRNVSEDPFCVQGLLSKSDAKELSRNVRKRPGDDTASSRENAKQSKKSTFSGRIALGKRKIAKQSKKSTSVKAEVTDALPSDVSKSASSKAEAAGALQSDGNKSASSTGKQSSPVKKEPGVAGKGGAASDKSAKAKAASDPKTRPKIPSGDDPIKYEQKNPKRDGSAAAERYEKYKTAKTVSKAKELGAWDGDIVNDFTKGYLKHR